MVCMGCVAFFKMEVMCLVEFEGGNDFLVLCSIGTRTVLYYIVRKFEKGIRAGQSKIKNTTKLVVLTRKPRPTLALVIYLSGS